MIDNKPHIIGYALAKQIPDIRNGCTIQTNYGELFISGSNAEQLSAFINDMYTKKLRQCVQLDGCVSCDD